MWRQFRFLPLNCVWLDPDELLQKILALFEEENVLGWQFTQGSFPLDSVFSSAPPKGGAHPGRLLIWHPRTLTFGGSVLLGNYEDGKIQLMRRLNRRFGVRFFHAVIAKDHFAAGACGFIYTLETGEKRVVQVLKDPSWEFFASGTPMPFEDTSSYDDRKIAMRLRPELVVKYLLELGWDLDSDAFWEISDKSWFGKQTFVRQ